MNTKVINCGKANIITLTWDTNIGKLPQNGQLLTNGVGNYFKVMKVMGKEVTLLQIE